MLSGFNNQYRISII